MINVDLLYPVGSIYLSIKSKNPGQIFGGVWEKIAKGRTLVGVDENDTDFSSSEKIGGEKEHTLTIDEMPKHAHKSDGKYTNYGSGSAATTLLNWGEGNASVQNTGGDEPHNNLQPYFTCYIFVRTA